jgi:hypothetical protein
MVGRARRAVLCVVLLSACGGQITSGGGPDSGGAGPVDAATGGQRDAPIVTGIIDAPIVVTTDAPTPVPDAPPNGNGCVPPTTIVLTPASLTQTVTPGAPYKQTFTATAHYASAPAANVTAQTFFTISDATVATFTGNTLTWAGDHGGTLTVTGTHCGVVSSVTITLELSTAFGTPGADPGPSDTQFGAAPPSTVAACAPQLVYPPDGILVPPNMNVIEVHFTLGTPANNLFEISFANAATNVRVYTKCNGATAAVGTKLGGGCVFELSQAEWNDVARTNRDGDPVHVTVRGLGCDGGNVAASSTADLSFAKEDLVGALFYWASMRVTVSGAAVNSGGVFKYDFGVRGASADPVLTPDSPANSEQGNCIGCHSVAKDGRKMVFDFDDNDDDDEIGDIFTDIFDLIHQTATFPIIKRGKNVFPAGFHTWNHEATEFLLSDGPGDTATPTGAFRLVSPTGATLGYTKPGTIRGTTPDWAPNDSEVVFVAPPNMFAAPPKAGYWLAKAGPADDLWFAGASLYTAPWDSLTSKLGSPTVILASTGTDNYYYPSYSPDGSLIAFNYASSGPNFHNPLARIKLIKAGGAAVAATDLAKLNGTGSLTNSWARWSPFVQAYQSGKILWITMSSTRDYGLRIQNGGRQNCYPTESPIKPAFTTAGVMCTRAQLWMAAIDLDPAAVAAGSDVSHPAFWLPFQDTTTNNHLAQWAERSFSGPCSSEGTCEDGKCCIMDGCTTCPIPPPPTPPECSADGNCPPSECCVAGACGTCPPPIDAGPGSPDAPPAPTTCLNCTQCAGQACIDGMCGSCTDTSQCCVGRVCRDGRCIIP